MTDETDTPHSLDEWWRTASSSADVADAEKRPSRLRTFRRIGSRRNAVAQCAGWRCRWSQNLQNPAAAVFRAATERTSLTDIQRRQIAAAAIGLRPGARTTFINDVECHLDARCHGRSPSDADISKAIEATLDKTPFWPKSVFMCDSIPNNKTGGDYA
jgi:hypothetical protein